MKVDRHGRPTYPPCQNLAFTMEKKNLREFHPKKNSAQPNLQLEVLVQQKCVIWCIKEESFLAMIFQFPFRKN